MGASTPGTANMLDRVAQIENHYNTLASRLSDPEVYGNQAEYVRISREQASLLARVVRAS